MDAFVNVCVVLVTAFAFLYLVYAMLFPERF
jgi:K+-transporting ATPase KdpF subunit